MTDRSENKIRSFEDLKCWQACRDLRLFVAKEVLPILKREERYRLGDQVLRAARSTTANLAEGFHRRSNKDFMRFLDYSRSSVVETVSHSYVALDQDYITQEELESVKQADVVWKKVNNFITYLSKSVRKGSNTRTNKTN